MKSTVATHLEELTECISGLHGIRETLIDVRDRAESPSAADAGGDSRGLREQILALRVERDGLRRNLESANDLAARRKRANETLSLALQLTGAGEQSALNALAAAQLRERDLTGLCTILRSALARSLKRLMETRGHG
jgi:hypothetical protein